MEDLSSNVREALLTKRQTRLNELDVRSLVERILNDLLVFLDCDGTSGVDNISTRLAVVVDGVDGRQDQLLLQMWEFHEVGFGFVLF